MSATLPSPRRYCRRCDYDLSAIEGPVCPECGREFSHANPKTYLLYPRQTWRARWRRWRWVIAAAFVLFAAWPRGWVFTETTWVDPSTKGSITSQSLVIAHPWWMKGWYPPIGRTSQQGGQTFTPQTSTVLLSIRLHRCDSVLLWRSENVGRGQLNIAGVPAEANVTPQEWTVMVREFIRLTGDATAARSAKDGGMSMVAIESIYKEPK